METNVGKNETLFSAKPWKQGVLKSEQKSCMVEDCISIDEKLKNATKFF